MAVFASLQNDPATSYLGINGICKLIFREPNKRTASELASAPMLVSDRRAALIIDEHVHACVSEELAKLLGEIILECCISALRPTCTAEEGCVNLTPF